MDRILFMGYPLEYYTGGAEYQNKLLEIKLDSNIIKKYLFMHPDKLNEDKYITYSFKRTSHPFNKLKELVIIYRLISQYSPDIIYKRGVDFIAAAGTYYSKKKNIRMILHVSSDKNICASEKPFRLKNILDGLLIKYAVHNAGRIICQSENQKSRLLTRFRRESAMIRNFHPLPPDNPVKQKPIKIVWIANYKPLKQPEVFISLAEHLEIPEAEFIMAGRYPLAEDGTTIKYISTCSSLYTLGEISPDEVNSLLDQAHILVNTSLYEGFPNTFVQAWLRGVVVVSLNVDPDNILEKENIGFHSKSFVQLAEDVKLLATNDPLREELSIKSRLIAERLFNIDTNLEKLISVLK